MEPDREQLQYIYNLLQRFQGNTLILDARPPAEFETIQLRGAISLGCLADSGPDLTFSQIQRAVSGTVAEQQFAKRKRMCILVCYGEGSRNLALAIYHLLQADRCKELHMLATPTERFLELYTFLSSGIRRAPVTSKTITYPNEILANQLFLGTQQHAESSEVMEHLGITHIVNATKTVANKFPDRIQYCRIVVDDQDTEMICYHFNIAFRFMDHALMENSTGAHHRILVHCAQGVSRSATIVIMYLMKKNDWPFDQAYQFTKRHRDVVHPNDGFQEQIREFEDARKRFKKAQMMRNRRRGISNNEPTQGCVASTS